MICQHNSVSFKSDKDIPSLEGKVILVTGGNVGLGKQCILEYARHNPAQIWLGARNLTKARAAADEITQQIANPPLITLLEIDLSSLASVAAAAQRVTTESSRLDILMLNAGGMGSPAGVTEDGYEVHFATNYISHALLAKLLLPLLEKTAKEPNTDVRVISLSSHGHNYAPKNAGGIDFTTLKSDGNSFGPLTLYSQSKLATILWTKQMAKLYPRLTFASIHPGLVRSNFLRGNSWFVLVMRVFAMLPTGVVVDLKDGVRNQLWASVADGVSSGEYYEPVGIGGTESKEAKDEKLMERMWEWTQEELGGYKAV